MTTVSYHPGSLDLSSEDLQSFGNSGESRRVFGLTLFHFSNFFVELRAAKGQISGQFNAYKNREILR